MCPIIICVFPSVSLTRWKVFICPKIPLNSSPLLLKGEQSCPPRPQTLGENKCVKLRTLAIQPSILRSCENTSSFSAWCLILARYAFFTPSLLRTQRAKFKQTTLFLARMEICAAFSLIAFLMAWCKGEGVKRWWVSLLVLQAWDPSPTPLGQFGKWRTRTWTIRIYDVHLRPFGFCEALSGLTGVLLQNSLWFQGWMSPKILSSIPVKEQCSPHWI